MPRLHFFEFTDQPWFPTFLRDLMTDYLEFVSERFKVFDTAVPILERGLKESEAREIVDLGSGAGGGALLVYRQLRERGVTARLILTDMFPYRYREDRESERKDLGVRYFDKPVDARNVPARLDGFRTLFLAFHHFRPTDARAILEDALIDSSGIAIFEATKRTIPNFLINLLLPLNVLLLTPFIRPFKWSRLLFTYLIPILPLTITWDGLVSVLRTYNTAEMQRMVDKADPLGRFDWEIKEVKAGPASMVYLLGVTDDWEKE